MKKSIYYWAPCLDRVGTEKSAKNSAIAVAKYSKDYDVSVINVFGEWSSFKEVFEKNEVKFINLGINLYNILPKKGFIFSRISYLIIILLSFIPLIILLKKNKPDFLVVHLITSLPIFLFKIINFRTKLILRISGFPKLNFFRKYLWKISSKSIHFVTCPSKELLEKLKKKNIFSSNKMFFLQDAILDIKEFIEKKNDDNFDKDFNKSQEYFLSIGRFSKQKNFKYLVNEFKIFKNENKSLNIKLLIIGDGEEKNNIQNLIKFNNLSEYVNLLDRTDNVYKYMKKSQAFILPSLWEEVGFVIVEAAICNTFIISSNCPNGPKEFLDNGNAGLLFKSNQVGELSRSLKLFIDNKINLMKKRKYAKKNSIKYTKFRHFKTLIKIINENQI